MKYKDPFLNNSMKPEEIDGSDPLKQMERVQELLSWFARLARGNANPKWTHCHAMELCYYISVTNPHLQIDLGKLTMEAFKEGLEVPEDSFLKQLAQKEKTSE